MVEVTGDDAADLYALCDTMERRQSWEELPEADRSFHLGLNRLGNELYGELVAAFWDVHGIIGPRLGVPTPRHSDTAIAPAACWTRRSPSRSTCTVGAHYAPLMRVLDQVRSRID